jgi:L-fuconolactonase
MVIVDAQVDVWGPNTPEHPWSPDGLANAHLPVPLGKDELLREMAAAGVDRVVIVPPPGRGFAMI